MNYTIFQVKKDRTREFGFMGFNFQIKHGGVSKENYDIVYSGKIEDLTTKTKPMEILEVLFAKFNIDRPEDFKGCSLSISDVIVIDDTSYYCDDFGWTMFNFE